jgi:predicted small lipoprotein YifL
VEQQTKQPQVSWETAMPARATLLVLSALLLAACGRAGEPLRPEPGVTVMQEGDKAAAEPAEDKPFILDPLL